MKIERQCFFLEKVSQQSNSLLPWRIGAWPGVAGPWSLPGAACVELLVCSV